MEPQLPAPSGEKAIYHKYLKTQIHSVKQVRFKQGRGNSASVLVLQDYQSSCLAPTKMRVSILQNPSFYVNLVYD